jgi:hypothetical protein
MVANPARAPNIDRGKPLTKHNYESLEAQWSTRELADAAHLQRVDDRKGAVFSPSVTEQSSFRKYRLSSAKCALAGGRRYFAQRGVQQ